MKTAALRPSLLAFCAGTASAQEASPSWAETGALFAERCVMCHSGEDAPLGLQLDSYGGAMAGSEDGPVLVAGNLAGSELLRRVRGESEPQMPLVGDPLGAEEIVLLEAWVEAGLPEGEVAATEEAPEGKARAAPTEEGETSAEAPAGASAAVEPPGPNEPITFAHVEPIFLRRCVVCHSDARSEGPPEGLRLDSYEHILEGGEDLVVLPGNPDESEIVQHIEGTEEPRMPFKESPLSNEQIELIRQWIAQGAADAEGNEAPVPTGRDDDDDADGHDNDDNDDNDEDNEDDDD